ncbi:MAG TPA: hypothetical protein VJG90_04200 [Candidatus Nanoarchaeia archaeon]|nr:hypothetical protein [Candidatus Nanoarchaeia archaeon]
MELRKLIAFGKATYSITLPKKWVTENALVKGDLILIQEKSPEKLEISPKLGEQQELIKEVTLSVNDKSSKELERELITAYINDYSIINLIGNVQGKVREIREMLNELIGLEIMEVSNNKTVAKVFSDVTNTHVSNIIRRISLITKAMFEELQSLFEGERNYASMVDSDREVNRQTYFATRILTKAIKSTHFRGLIKMELTEAAFALKVIDMQEKIGDQLKNMARQLCDAALLKKSKAKFNKEFAKYTHEILVAYENAVKAYIMHDRKLAGNTIEETRIIREKLDVYIKEHCELPVPYVLGNLGVLASHIADLGLVVYNTEF